MIKYILIVLVLILTSNTFALDSLIFIIRVDDIMSRNTAILPRSIVPFENAVNSRNAKVTWAVIPHRLIEYENQDGVIKQELINSIQNGHEVCQHGYNHYCPIDYSWNHEMFCSGQQVHFSYAYQESLLVAGKQILYDSLGIYPTSFVPPGHSVDTTSYNVLLDNNINFISTTGSSKQFIHNNLFNLKPHNEFAWALTPAQYNTKLTQALADIRTQGQADGYYCLLFHDYFIRQGYEGGLVIQWTAELLDSLISEYGSNIKFKTLSETAEIFSNPTSVLSSNNENYPESLTLLGNYPNPFNPSTKIQFSIAKSEFVMIRIFNLLSQNVSTLASEPMSPGKHTFEWNATDYASGIYYYSIETPSAQKMGKMMLIK